MTVTEAAERRAVAGSSRGLLMTLLGEFVLPSGGSAWTQTLLRGLATLGVQEKSGRQTIARMGADGWLDSQRIGRHTRWTLSPTAVDLLTSGAERIYGFGRGSATWDHRWLVLLASIPERDRDLRHRMAVQLRWAGFGSLRNGTWVSPRAHHEADAARVVGDLGVDATLFRAELSEIGRGEDLVAEAWDLDALRHRYESFLSETEGYGWGEGDESVSELARLVHAWRRFPFVDPELPADLLPIDWPAATAVERFTACRESLRPAAVQWWTDAEIEATPSR